MIISHQHRFIFIKPIKVAGTSVEANLAKQCGPDDVITPTSTYNSAADEHQYRDYSQNYSGFAEHMSPAEIREKVGEQIWDEYYKFTIVRNPWDLVVSRYFWEQFASSNLSLKIVKPSLVSYFSHLSSPQSYLVLLKRLWGRLTKELDGRPLHQQPFETYVKYFKRHWMNTRYYFDQRGQPWCDEYLKFENLDNDYKKLVKKLGLKYEALPRLKTKVRADKQHYSKYYNEISKKQVRNNFKSEILRFNYRYLNYN